MKTVIMYDSSFGNTEKVAEAVRSALGKSAATVHVSQASQGQMKGLELLVVASPTLGGKPTEAIQAFLNGIAPNALKGVRVAALDTRSAMKFTRLFGYAAEKISAILVARGGTPAGTPTGFIVKGRKGPLADGELERAAAWAKSLGGRA